MAGLTDKADLIRLFPVPFRLISDEKQFRKWQWITARIEKAPADRRLESHKIFVDTVQCDPEPLSTGKNWAERRAALNGLKVYDDFETLEQDRVMAGTTLGLIRPSKILGLDITPVDDPEWTDNEKQKLEQNERQIGLFEAVDAKSLATLRKLPFLFHYRYECNSEGESKFFRHKIADWEAGALYWKCRQRYGNSWEQPFRDKLMGDLSKKDLMFLMGTIHRFPNQWLIVSLIYPPKLAPDAEFQQSMQF